jgi:hypothetical protein
MRSELRNAYALECYYDSCRGDNSSIYRAGWSDVISLLKQYEIGQRPLTGPLASN